MVVPYDFLTILATSSIFNESTSNLGICVLDDEFTTLITSTPYGKQFPKSRFNNLIQQFLSIQFIYLFRSAWRLCSCFISLKRPAVRSSPLNWWEWRSSSVKRPRSVGWTFIHHDEKMRTQCNQFHKQIATNTWNHYFSFIKIKTPLITHADK